MLKQRILTAIILIPVFVALVLFLPPKHFSVVTGIVVIWAAFEWSGLMGLRGFPKNIIFPFLMIVVLAVILVLFFKQILSMQIILYASSIFWLIALIMVISYPRGTVLWGKSFILRGLMGIMVLLPCWTSINFIRLFPNGTFILLFLFVLIWGADTGAYFAGKKWGKHKLLPQVSPGKTWQGLLGALMTTVLLVFAVAFWFHSPSSVWVPLLILSLSTVLFSVLGDLFESMLKRNEGLKDSGHLLPGHGGILDRIDSLTAAAPMFAFGALLLGKVS